MNQHIVSHRPPWLRQGAILSSFIVALLLFLTVSNTLAAQGPEPTPPNLDTSAKTANVDQVEPGDTVEYTIQVNNSGTTPAASVMVTDALPLELDYVSGTLQVTGGGLFGVTNNVITWTGALNNDASVEIQFRARVSDTLMSGDVITNSATFTGTGMAFTRLVTTTVYTTNATTAYLPIIIKSILPPEEVTDFAITRPTANNEWTLSWNLQNTIFVTGYEIIEGRNPDLSDGQIIATTQAKSYAVDRPVDTDNVYFYAVRAVGPGGEGPWSDIKMVIGAYHDNFNSGSTQWKIVKQDTDDTDNSMYLEDNHLVMEIDGRWDYAIGSPLQPAPNLPYRIKTSVRLEQPGNLNAYGIIFGADWDGTSQCPTSDFEGCFNRYYRLIVSWFAESSNAMKIQLKRIDFHDSDNVGRGETKVIDDRVVSVNPPPSGYQQWAIEVYPDGRIRLFVNDKFVASGQDTDYIYSPYFGTMAATDEYLGAEPHFDWFEVLPIAP